MDFSGSGRPRLPLDSSIHWERKPYVRTLLEASDEFECYGVILTDWARARLFTVCWGQIEELQEIYAEADVRHAKTSGSDHMRSQMQFQRKAQVHAHRHLKEVVATMEKMARRHHFDRLVLAGPVEATSEILALLSPQLKRKVVATMTLPVDSSAQQILTETLRTEEQAERAGEGELVEHLLTSAAKKDRAVVGLKATLESLQEGRIRVLVYAQDLAPLGSRCQGCQMLLGQEAEECPYCGGALDSVEDLVEAFLERVVREGGRAEQVRSTAADRLRQVCKWRRRTEVGDGVKVKHRWC